MNWKQVGRFVRTVFVLRVPLFTLAVLAALGPLAHTVAQNFLANLFDVRVLVDNPISSADQGRLPPLRLGWSAWSLFAVSLAAFMLAWAAVSVINLIVHYGKDRFDDPALDLEQKHSLLTFLCGLAAALSLVIWAIRDTRIEWYVRYGMPLLALAASLLLVTLAKVVQLLFTDPKTTRHPPPFLVFPAYVFAGLERFFDNIYCWRSDGTSEFKGIINRASQWPLEILRCAGQGYLIDYNAPPGKLALRSGHVFAIVSSLISFALYVSISIFKGRVDSNPSKVPALAFVLLFLIVSCWFLGALTFFFDRYRVPLLTFVALLSLATTFSPESDHIYRVHEFARPALKKPYEVVKDRAEGGKRRLILVSAAGGGIQAAAWTAQVLVGLEQACAEQTETGKSCDFRNSVVLISSVSGGSLGALAYARSFATEPCSVPSREVVDRAAKSAIDEVAWGWTNPDVARAILPWFRHQYIDRGWALEERWAAVNELRQCGTNEENKEIPDCHFGNGRKFTKCKQAETFLSDWGSLPNNMPALLLNSTVVESGLPLVFSTTEFPGKDHPGGLRNFYELYPELAGKDVSVDTAARISASFPYVAPAARSDGISRNLPDFHLVDGGYYDNFGMTSLLGWLHDAIENSPLQQREEIATDLVDVLVLEIRPFPAADPQNPGSPHGWGYQLIAPAAGLLDVRDTGQSAHANAELGLFTRYYQGKNINVWHADLQFPQMKGECERQPLSWKLSIDQMNCIQEGWNRFRGTNGVPPAPEVACVMRYLNYDQLPHPRDKSSESTAPYCLWGYNQNWEQQK